MAGLTRTQKVRALREARSLAATKGWVTRQTNKLHTLQGGKWIVWNPNASTPPTRRFVSAKQARAICHKLASENPTEYFIACELHDVIGGIASVGIPPELRRFKSRLGL
jgi:hypothetical protein